MPSKIGRLVTVYSHNFTVIYNIGTAPLPLKQTIKQTNKQKLRLTSPDC